MKFSETCPPRNEELIAPLIHILQHRRATSIARANQCSRNGKCDMPRRVARGGQWGNCPPPIPKVALTIFKLIKLLMCKSKKCVSANQRKCLKKLFYFNFYSNLIKAEPIARCWTSIVCSRGQQPTARAPHLARQAISNGTQKLHVLHIDFVMIHS